MTQPKLTTKIMDFRSDDFGISIGMSSAFSNMIGMDGYQHLMDMSQTLFMEMAATQRQVNAAREAAALEDLAAAPEEEVEETKKK